VPGFLRIALTVQELDRVLLIGKIAQWATLLFWIAKALPHRITDQELGRPILSELIRR
jgi:hypothetical protein